MPLQRRQKPAQNQELAAANPVDESLRPLSVWYIVLAVVAVILVAAPLTWWLFTIAGPDPGRQIDAIRTGLTTAAGTGGVFALLLAFHRQRSTEKIAENARLASKRDHDQRERQAEVSERDALTRRIADQYTSAAEQLGSEKAPVRLAAIYALERIGVGNESERQTVIDILCAYLRMPYIAPRERTGMLWSSDLSEDIENRRTEELQVRKTAQSIISNRLGVFSSPWGSISVDLSDATLVDFDLSVCDVQNLTLKRASLFGRSSFLGIRVAGVADFRGSHWSGDADFDGATFTGQARFEQARFMSRATFNRTEFLELATFNGSEVEDLEFNGYAVRQPDGALFHSWPGECIEEPINRDKVLIRLPYSV